MMELKTVFDRSGNCLGDEYVDLTDLQQDTKKAILQMIYLDKTVDDLNDQLNQIPST